MTILKNRTEAGKKLAEKISKSVKENVIVLAIPRGGVPIGFEIAEKLHCKLDIVISKKITPPGHPEYAIGAITCDGMIFEGPFWDKYSNEPDFEKEIKNKEKEVSRRLKKFRKNEQYNLKDLIVILVDDGIATGSTIFVLLKWLKKQNIKQVIVATPVISSDAYEKMNKISNVIALEISNQFSSVGQFYEEFEQVSDDEVLKLLEKTK